MLANYVLNSFLVSVKLESKKNPSKKVNIKMVNIIFKIILTFVLYLSFPFLFLFFSIIIIFRFCVSKILTTCDPTLGKILTTRSSGAATDKIYEAPKVTLVTVSTYEGTIDFDTLRTEFENRVVFVRNAAGELLRPELRQYVTRRFGFSFWKYDPNFKIENHVKIYDGQFKDSYAKAPCVTPEMVLTANEELLYGPFRPKRSPWELHVFYNYKDSPDSPISTALALRIHHTLGDGFSIRNLTLDLLNELTENKGETDSIPISIRILQGIGFLFTAPFQIVSKTLEANDSPIWKVDESKMRRTFNFGISPMIPLDKIKEVRRITKSSFTAVILECFTAALRRFMTEAGHGVPKRIHCITPLPFPGHPGRKMRNHMTGCMTPLPVGMEDRIARLRKIDQDLLEIRRSTYTVNLFLSMGIGGGLFRKMIKRFATNTLTTAIMSNFPGPEKAMAFNQHPLRSMYFCGGLFRGTCAMGFSALSCIGNIRFVFGVDDALVSSAILPASFIVQYFLEELDLLKTAVNLN